MGTLTLQRALAQQVEEAQVISPEMIANAEWITGITLTDEERGQVAEELGRTLQAIEDVRALDIGYDVGSCLSFNPAPWLPPCRTAVNRNRATLLERGVAELPTEPAKIGLFAGGRVMRT